MKIKYQWFLGGKVMFYVAIILILVLCFIFTTTYVIDPFTVFSIKKQSLSPSSIQMLSEKYVECLRCKNR